MGHSFIVRKNGQPHSSVPQNSCLLRLVAALVATTGGNRFEKLCVPGGLGINLAGECVGSRGSQEGPELASNKTEVPCIGLDPAFLRTSSLYNFQVCAQVVQAVLHVPPYVERLLWLPHAGCIAAELKMHSAVKLHRRVPTPCTCADSWPTRGLV